MAITQAICNSYKQELLQGIHATTDTYKAALYTSAATIGPGTTVYSATNEVSGSGYSAGGIALSNLVSGLSGSTAYLDADDIQWLNATITARGMLIYNSTKANRAVAVFDFGADYTSTNGTFLIQLPAPGATAFIRVA